MQFPLKPKAKFENLVVQEFSDEILIYNLENNKAYSLNQTSKLVWQNCDGQKDISQIADEMTKSLKQEVTDDVVWLALDNLTKEGLISLEGDIKTAFAGFNRREVIKRVGLTTMVALPLMISVMAPQAANAASGAPASACSTCSMKNDPCVMGCELVTGNCYDNSGCGNGQFISNVTCSQCKAGIFNGGLDTGSWEEVVNP